MLTISLVNDILARLQQEHEVMQSDGNTRRPTSSMNQYVTKNKRELHAQ